MENECMEKFILVCLTNKASNAGVYICADTDKYTHLVKKSGIIPT